MNKRLIKALAIIGLIFMAVFSVSLVINLADSDFFGGYITAVTAISGVLGFICFIAVKILRGDTSLSVNGEDETDTDAGLPANSETDVGTGLPAKDSAKTAADEKPRQQEKDGDEK